MLRTRLVTAAIALPALWLIVWRLWQPLFAVFVLLVIAVAAMEYAAMALPQQRGAAWLLLGATQAVAVGLLAQGPWPGVVLGASFLVALLLPLAAPHDLTGSVQRAALWWFGVAYVGFLLPHGVLLRASSPHGWCWVLFVIFVAMGSDTGGYFGGRWFGRHKLFPAVSPAKTVEGAMGSLVGAIIVAVACRLVFFGTVDLETGLGLPVAVSVLAQCGDLCESALKRAFGVKDSGWIVPGHGGILDRLDSLLLPFVFLYYWVVVTGR